MGGVTSLTTRSAGCLSNKDNRSLIEAVKLCNNCGCSPQLVSTDVSSSCKRLFEFPASSSSIMKHFISGIGKEVVRSVSSIMKEFKVSRNIERQSRDSGVGGVDSLTSTRDHINTKNNYIIYNNKILFFYLMNNISRFKNTVNILTVDGRSLWVWSSKENTDLKMTLKHTSLAKFFPGHSEAEPVES